jgi:hypothetical protein
MPYQSFFRVDRRSPVKGGVDIEVEKKELPHLQGFRAEMARPLLPRRHPGGEA